ncbi:MAG: phosphate ABC transporter substrate-binding protein, partial [Candidatus Acidiferrales bacterium]
MAALAAACGGRERSESAAGGGNVTIKGSDTMVILGQRWAEVFMRSNPG